jgi:hypothetical protein
MGTRTYSRRRADGTRVPTALGIRTGKFTGGGVGGQGAGRQEIPERLQTLMSQFNFGFNDARDGILRPNIDPSNVNASFPADLPKFGQASPNPAFAPRRLVGDASTTRLQRNKGVEATRSDGRQLRALGGESDWVSYDRRIAFDEIAPLTTPYNTILRRSPNMIHGDIIRAVDEGEISPSNGQRATKAALTVAQRILKANPNLTEQQRRAVVTIVGAMAGLAAQRSNVYDTTMLNPDGQGTMNGRLGTALKRTADRITKDSQALGNALNRVLGEPVKNGLPRRGSTGGNAYSTITAGVGQAAHYSSLKFARENEQTIGQMQRDIKTVYNAEFGA